MYKANLSLTPGGMLTSASEIKFLWRGDGALVDYINGEKPAGMGGNCHTFSITDSQEKIVAGFEDFFRCQQSIRIMSLSGPIIRLINAYIYD
jgi:hypothetical protein